MKITEKCRINILKKEIFIQLKIKKVSHFSSDTFDQDQNSRTRSRP